jgi:hypothetical protein
MSKLAVKKAARKITFRRRFAENFFIVAPGVLSDCSPARDLQQFRFRNSQPRIQIFYRDALAHAIAIYAIQHRELFATHRALPRARCFNFNELRVVTFAQRRRK